MQNTSVILNQTSRHRLPLHLVHGSRRRDNRRYSRGSSSLRVARTACRLWNRRLARLIAYGVSQNSLHRRLDDAPDLNADNAPDLQLVLAQLARVTARQLAAILAHAVTHDACAEMPRNVREVVAEPVAYAVYTQFGLDLSLGAVDDVTGWGHPQGHAPTPLR